MQPVNASLTAYSFSNNSNAVRIFPSYKLPDSNVVIPNHHYNINVSQKDYDYSTISTNNHIRSLCFGWMPNDTQLIMGGTQLAYNRVASCSDYSYHMSYKHSAIRDELAVSKVLYEFERKAKGANAEVYVHKLLTNKDASNEIPNVSHKNPYSIYDQLRGNLETIDDLYVCRETKFLGDSRSVSNLLANEVKGKRELHLHFNDNIGRPIGNIILDDDINLGTIISTEQPLITQMVFTFNNVFTINSYRISNPIVSFWNHNNLMKPLGLLEEITSDLDDSPTNERANHYYNEAVGHIDYYNNLFYRYYDSYHRKYEWRKSNPKDSVRITNEHQKIGVYGVESLSEITLYDSKAMSFEMIKVDTLDRDVLFSDPRYKSIRLVIVIDNKSTIVEFEHHYDVSFLRLPLSMLDIELMFLINNTKWSSIDEILYNLVHHKFGTKYRSSDKLCYYHNDYKYSKDDNKSKRIRMYGKVTHTINNDFVPSYEKALGI